ncbi:hypothetical protein HMPREF9997_02226 [Corynebacterium durum F0235]|uniref:Uncharacterized protein n=1 Tax=Corynebacterium durum F0235 TaxID=1035195 RepID=L1MBF4_9CORY|nr:hypothetical protein HMPREF9997_02226 [Corynebacterium durum F0235]
MECPESSITALKRRNNSYTSSTLVPKVIAFQHPTSGLVVLVINARGGCG